MIRCFAGARACALPLVAVALLAACCSLARAEAPASKNPAGLSLGAALWAEIGDCECPAGSDPTSCGSSGPRCIFPGGFASFDLDLLHWLRLGVSLGLGYSSASNTELNEHTSFRTWFVPLSLHMYWRVELGKRITLWGGPELGLGLYVASRTRSAPDLASESTRSTRSGFLAGVAVGLDVRLSGPLRIGLELGQAILLSPERSVATDADDDGFDLHAVTRFALVLRYL